MKRFTALLLICAVMAALVGCDGSAGTTTSGTLPTTSGTVTTAPTTVPTEPTTEPEPPVDLRYWVDHENCLVIGGSIEAALSSGEALSVSFNDPYKGRPGFDYTTPDVFTLRQYLTGVTDLNWSPANWQTSEDAYILDQTTTGLYVFTLNSDLTGWTIVPELAAAAPVDVTQEYAGQYGIEAGEAAKAWRIALNPNACFHNGAAINADTYIYSYQQLLDSRMDHCRADQLCSGNFSIFGAAQYHDGNGDWENVGILKTGEYEIVLITEKAVSQPEFYVPYYLQSTCLLYEPLWESCKQYFDKDDNPLDGDCPEAVRMTSTYCTSLDTAVSYGPYVLTEYTAGEAIHLERNYTWYGYMDGLHLGQYQTDAISCRIFGSYAEVLAAYEAGELDAVALQSADIAAWLDSGLLRQQPETYITKLTFNTDPEALAARGTQLLANPTFRKAFSLAIDRSRFSAGYIAPDFTGLGLINEAYADPVSGLVYRETDSAQNALNMLYGADFGYDLETAKALMAQAFEECLDQGLYDGDSAVTLQLSVYRQEEAYGQICQFLNDALAAAVAGSGFEGKVSIQLVVDENCYNAMQNGQTDLIFSTWGGNAFDPYSILYRCYCSDARLEYGFDPAATTVQTQINGEVFSATMLDWALWCAGQRVTITSASGVALEAFDRYDGQTRAAIFAELEFAYLSQYAVTPLYSRGSILLLSEKGDYAVKNALPLVGFGGLRYYTFQYTDIQWSSRNDILA